MALETIGWGAVIEKGDPDHLVIFVSGYTSPRSPEFHFSANADKYNQTKLYLRDHTNLMYAEGIKDVTKNEEENLEFLRYIIKKIGAKRVSIVSGSMATHPSILWGHELGVNDIHLIGGMFDIDLCLRQERAYHPMFEGTLQHFQKLQSDKWENRALREYMDKNADKVDSIDIYYGIQDEIDYEQALTVETSPNVRSTIYKEGNHLRVPIFVLRRDEVYYDRMFNPIEKPAELRKNKKTDDDDQGLFTVKVAT